MKAIHQSVKVLELPPGIGRLIEDVSDEFREWIADFGDSGYVTRCSLDLNAVVILAVRHQKEVGYLWGANFDPPLRRRDFLPNLAPARKVP
ncbi:GNAT family N-acetyltransferase [Paracidovorax anthurii]|uniref:Uncharacterized protein n=1 Tax=Paracidovorax anthurii TaxID=78229 RepID=A0A328YQH7_9BURK|nr:hypothetical protein AX018_10507 [Paracidovorax anthurii]